jgi:hypothetical protein
VLHHSSVVCYLRHVSLALKSGGERTKSIGMLWL